MKSTIFFEVGTSACERVPVRVEASADEDGLPEVAEVEAEADRDLVQVSKASWLREAGHFFLFGYRRTLSPLFTQAT